MGIRDSLFAIACCLIWYSAALGAESDRKLLIVYDSSNSMWGELSDQSRKFEAGRSALSEFLASEFDSKRIGLRAYGHRRKTDCRDSELVVRFTSPEAAVKKITSAVTRIRPTGKTPITYSLREAVKDFDGAEGDILLISDGIETCDIDPCELMRQWQATNVNIRVHVVGVGLSELERSAMSCIADISGGAYFDAKTEGKFAEALNQASDAIALEPDEPNPVATIQDYALILLATDSEGRSYITKGTLLRKGEEIGEVSSAGRNILAEPGEYSVRVGPVLQDGSVFEPVEAGFSISERGEVKLNVTVEKPAIVRARFTEEGQKHRGSLIRAFQKGEEAFSFRSFDEALVRPGTYEFRARPNEDNDLRVTQEFTAGQEAEIVFGLTKTIQFYVTLVLPTGEKIYRNSELWLDGKKKYSVHSNNGGLAKPGVYELRSDDDQNLPLDSIEVEITEDGETIEVPVSAGFLKVSYGPPLEDYIGNAFPDRVFITALDRGGRSFNRPDTTIPLAPGQYRIEPFDRKGFFETQEIEVTHNDTIEVIITPKRLGELSVRYAQSDAYSGTPNRAFVTALEGQRVINGTMRVGEKGKFLPGRYRVSPAKSAVGVNSMEVEIVAGEVIEITLN